MKLELKNKSGIYAIINNITGMLYVGSAINIHKRFLKHESLLRNNKHHCNYLQNSYNFHTCDAFVFSVLEYINNVEDLIIREQWYINYFEFENLFNSSPKAGSTLGAKYSDKAKQKMSNAHKGKKLSQKHIQNISNAIKGKKHSDKAKQKISNGHKGKKHSKEHIQKLAESHKKKVIQINKDTQHSIKLWESATDAALQIANAMPSNISACCRGIQKSAYGYKWQYA